MTINEHDAKWLELQKKKREDAFNEARTYLDEAERSGRAVAVCITYKDNPVFTSLFQGRDGSIDIEIPEGPPL